MRTPIMDRLRGVVQGLSEDGKKPINNALVYNALALETEEEKARIRSRLNDLARRKELTKTNPGQYTYNAKSQADCKGEGYIRMWRAVRASSAAWTISDIAAVAHMNASSVGKYVKDLVDCSLVRRNGKKDRNLRFSITPAGRKTRETPYPPRETRDPHAKERAAMSRLSRIFFELDLYSSKARKGVVSECRIILERFDRLEGKEGEDGE